MFYIYVLDSWRLLYLAPCRARTLAIIDYFCTVIIIEKSSNRRQSFHFSPALSSITTHQTASFEPVLYEGEITAQYLKPELDM